ncbi:MAG: type II toxin-antitoxin system VapC family toxin [Notoacmeibacter sp.]|nr:type II toxin-antitoxin system VapC family toxin [Notoacmeibacter sp.]MCC0032453.1 type II toxin-antitoxin system VapC family toxin [Brucellaceae bacterium]
MIAVDSSAIFAVLRAENDAALYGTFLAENSGLVMCAPTLVECHYVIHGFQAAIGRQTLDAFLAAAGIDVVATDTTMIHHAVEARYRYGKGTGHPARLNFGDCFSYALAKSRDLPLLYKGDDFVHTDVRSALGEA